MTCCRSCGANPLEVLKRAIAMRLSGAVPGLVGFEFATRWRDLPGGRRDLCCWFCQLWCARLHDVVQRVAA